MYINALNRSNYLFNSNRQHHIPILGTSTIIGHLVTFVSTSTNKTAKMLNIDLRNNIWWVGLRKLDTIYVTQSNFFLSSNLEWNKKIFKSKDKLSIAVTIFDI